MASSTVLNLTCTLLLCMLSGAHFAQAAITCNQVTNAMLPCFPYLMGTGPLAQTCCNGIRALKNAANTTPDRRQACSCLKSAAASAPGVNLGAAAGLPRQCGVNIPYQISPSIDCSRIN